jgi:hypothetical protein
VINFLDEADFLIASFWGRAGDGSIVEGVWGDDDDDDEE